MANYLKLRFYEINTSVQDLLLNLLLDSKDGMLRSCYTMLSLREFRINLVGYLQINSTKPTFQLRYLSTVIKQYRDNTTVNVFSRQNNRQTARMSRDGGDEKVNNRDVFNTQIFFNKCDQVTNDYHSQLCKVVPGSVLAQ